MLNTGTNTRRNKHHYEVNIAKLVSSLYYKKVMRNTFSLKQKSAENQQTATADILFLAGPGTTGRGSGMTEIHTHGHVQPLRKGQTQSSKQQNHPLLVFL